MCFLRKTWLVFAIILPLTICFCDECCEAQTIRIGYVIPSNRAPQTKGAANLAKTMLSIQNWYGDQMERFGFGAKTFKMEMEADGVTPKVNVINVGVTDDYLREDLWEHTLNAANSAGLKPWKRGEILVLVPEAHLQKADGSVIGTTALGASFGSGDNGGIAMVGSNNLPLYNSPVSLRNTTKYAGQIIPEIGPLPLVQDKSFHSFEGETISSVASSLQGALAHEIGHALGLPHDHRNDNNFDGNLMGNGLRGWRGSRLPKLFPKDDAQLGYGAALTLNTSRYFNADTPYIDKISPTINVLTSGTVDPVNGQLEIMFDAADAGGIASAMLYRDGQQTAELAISGNNVSTSFLTPYFEADKKHQYSVVVLDQMGNRQTARVDITVNGTPNLAPQPYLNLDRSTVSVGEVVVLDVLKSFDPDHSLGDLQVEWDLDGDGTFDTLPSFDKEYNLTIDSIGARLVSARITDPSGAWAVSAPLSIVGVPEPSSALLASLSLVGLGFVRRRRK